MSPLATEIYKQLCQHVRACQAAIPPGADPPVDRGQPGADPDAAPRSRASSPDAAPRASTPDAAPRASTLTYKELATAVGRADPSLATHPRSSSFHAALGEVTAACRAAGLPCLPAIVCRRDTRRPSAGYYKAAHPRVRSDDGREGAWRREHARVLAEIARFPEVLP